MSKVVAKFPDLKLTLTKLCWIFSYAVQASSSASQEFVRHPLPISTYHRLTEGHQNNKR